jgi:hypothetical protein
MVLLNTLGQHDPRSFLDDTIAKQGIRLTLAEERPETEKRHCERMTWVATINWNHISASATYMMREERLWNVAVPPRARLSNPIHRCS